MPRRIAVTKRVSLEGIADGWTDAAYAVVTLASYAEFRDIANLSTDKKSNLELLDYQLKFTKDHVVNGKVFILNDANEQVLDDLQKSDIDGSKELADKLFNEIVGVAPNPKDSLTPTAE